MVGLPLLTEFELVNLREVSQSVPQYPPVSNYELYEGMTALQVIPDGVSLDYFIVLFDTDNWFRLSSLWVLLLL